MLEVRLTILGDQAFARAFSRYGDAVKDFRPVWKQIHASFLAIEREQFQSEGARGGKPWAQLSPTYAAWKAKNFPGTKILQRSGLMANQMSSGSGLTVKSEPMALTMSPIVPRAGIHQHEAPARRLPARQVVVLTEADKTNWVKMIHNYIYDKAKEAHLA